MITFNDSISIHICARTDEERNAWATSFGSFFENFTRTDGIGGWVGDVVVETEPVIIVTRWGRPDADFIRRFCDAADNFQAAARQEAVAVQVVANGRWSSFIVFAGEWGDAFGAISDAFGGRRWPE